jgi:hypothetical protein
MATNVTRTVTDDATDALAALNDAELELVRMRQHIERAIASAPGRSDEQETRGFVYQALHCGDIVEARVGDALKHARAMRCAMLAEASS